MASTTPLRERFKNVSGWALARSNSKLTFANCLFILAHMRCGSTALSNILCSRPDVSGYGEAHIRYDGRSALGRLALNQMRHQGWDRSADQLFDKILHSRHDEDAPPEFFESRAIFVIREPEPTIRSICKLYADLGRKQYGTHEAAARYYVERLDDLARMWAAFPEGRRIGMTHKGLLQDPDAALQRITDHFGFAPPLHNSYVSHAASRKGGGGDPMVSGQHERIEPALLKPTRSVSTLDIPADLAQAAQDRFKMLRELIAHDWPSLV